MKPLLALLYTSICLACAGPNAFAGAQPAGADMLTEENFRAFELRNVCPAVTPARVADIAIDPKNRNTWYIATAASGVWKTTNRGNTWRPIFDTYGSYSTGCITIDPKNSDVIWLGSGENQSLRSVSYGDGLYKSTDAGATWKKVGLDRSEHIARILIDPRNSDVVYVAAQGPLWAPGGDRGLYKTTDGGATWKPVLQISENTGITEIAFDPRNADVIYAASYQRRRHVGQLVGGGPEAGVFKTTDAGAHWEKLTNGLPTVDLGRMALAVSPQQPDVVYLQICAIATGSPGMWRSADAGKTWEHQSDYRIQDAQYYGELFCDPHQFDKVYVIDTVVGVTTNGGKNIARVNWSGIHVDNHALDFDPKDPNHMLLGNDGGLYETFDGGRYWHHFDNMPMQQFYALAVDNALPFYYVYGGAQDNGSLGGPSRTTNAIGIRNSDWMVVGGGDGMQPRVDPTDPSILYIQSQNAAINRVNLQVGSASSIRPAGGARGGAGAGARGGAQTNATARGDAGGGEGEADIQTNTVAAGGGRAGGRGGGGIAAGVRWNWNTPVIVSPHSPSRIYLAGSKIFRSDDRGTNWKAISPDITRQLDRDALPIMGKVWTSNVVSKNTFTTDLGVSTGISESPKKEGLIYIGTDDGLVQVTDNSGDSWRKIDKFPGVPEFALCSDVSASPNDVDTVYASFNNYQRGDFHPYLLKSTNRGKDWTSIAGNLPTNHPVWCILEDPVNKNLLFTGTEFGLFVSIDGGKKWVQLRNGVATAAFRDMEIQQRECDLVCATFGRGFYILDDYSALRQLTPETFSKDFALLPLRRAQVYNEFRYGRTTPGNIALPNPQFGAMFTYYLRNDMSNATNTVRLALNVTDSKGATVRQINAPATAGLHRVNWTLRGNTVATTDTTQDQADWGGDDEEASQAPGSAEELEPGRGGGQRNAGGQAGAGAGAADTGAGAGEADTGAGGEVDATQTPAARGAGRGGAGAGGRGGRGGRGGGDTGPLVVPGTYKVTLGKVEDGKFVPMGESQSFEVVPLQTRTAASGSAR